MDEALRIALLTYRGHPEVGGQGVYVRYLSDALAVCGHHVTVFSGPPYPDLGTNVSLHPVPGLDLYRPDDPFRRPAASEFRTPTDIYEYAAMCMGTFPEPLTFTMRMNRALAGFERGFDVVHDNQSLGYGLLPIARRLPTVATIHHPISVDRRMAVDHASTWAKKLGQKRWYSFVSMQARVARRMRQIISVSTSARDDIVRDFQVVSDRISVVHNGVDADLFRPVDDVQSVPGRIIAIVSSAQASKGLDHLIEAIAKLATERDVSLTLVGRGGTDDRIRALITRFGIADRVRVLGRIEALELVDELAHAQVAVVPSLYEGFSLPAVEAMACGVPLVATSGGALPEVVGDAGLLVASGDAGALATGIARVMDDPDLAATLGRLGRKRVLERFTWTVAAHATVETYREAMARC